MSHSDQSTSKTVTFSRGAFKFGRRLVYAAPVIPMWTAVYVGLFSIILVATLRPSQED
jgi:hypothetical protein